MGRLAHKRILFGTSYRYYQEREALRILAWNISFKCGVRRLQGICIAQGSIFVAYDCCEAVDMKEIASTQYRKHHTQWPWNQVVGHSKMFAMRSKDRPWVHTFPASFFLASTSSQLVVVLLLRRGTRWSARARVVLLLSNAIWMLGQ